MILTLPPPEGQRCSDNDCNQPAHCIAYDPILDRSGYYCVNHALRIVDTHHPEYAVDCPNCGCMFGVN